MAANSDLEVNPPAEVPSIFRGKYPRLIIGWFLASLVVMGWLIEESTDLLFQFTVFVLLAGVGMYFAVLHREERVRIKEGVQEDRDRFALAILARLQQGVPVPAFSLYLRPFFTDNELMEPAPFRFSLGHVLAWIIKNTHREFERELAEAMLNKAPVIALGGRKASVGAGRIWTSDEEWRDVLEILLVNASYIFIIPIGQPSTLLEINALSSRPELLSKSVFVRPSNIVRSHFAFGENGEMRALSKMWEWTRLKLLSALPSFPSFEGNPRLFAFTHSGNVREWYGDGLFSIHQRPGISAAFSFERPKTRWLLSIIAISPLIAALRLSSAQYYGLHNWAILVVLALYVAGLAVVAAVVERAPAFILRALLLAFVVTQGLYIFQLPLVSLVEDGSLQSIRGIYDQYLLLLTLRVIAGWFVVYLIYDLQCRLWHYRFRWRAFGLCAALVVVNHLTHIFLLGSWGEFSRGSYFAEALSWVVSSAPVAGALALGAGKGKSPAACWAAASIYIASYYIVDFSWVNRYGMGLGAETLLSPLFDFLAPGLTENLSGTAYVYIWGGMMYFLVILAEVLALTVTIMSLRVLWRRSVVDGDSDALASPQDEEVPWNRQKAC